MGDATKPHHKIHSTIITSQGTALHLPLPRFDPLEQGPVPPNLPRLHDRLRRHVGGIDRGDGQRPIAGGEHVDLSEPVRLGILRVPVDRRGVDHCNTPVHVVRHPLAGFDMARAGISVGDAGLVDFRGAVREAGTEVAGAVPRVLLLPAFGVADPPVLRDGD